MISTKSISRNDSFSIRENLDPDSNRTDESDLHSEKHEFPMNSTDEGRVRFVKPVEENASPAIRDN
jgi:hypothetical protein